MYATFYGLHIPAFNITPDPAFLYLSPSHKETLGTVVYGVLSRKGLVSVVGEVGTGKTTLIRAVLEQTDPKFNRMVYVEDPMVSFERLAQRIFQALGRSYPEEKLPDETWRTLLAQALMDEREANVNVALLIDEAQLLSHNMMEQLRLLTNLETDKEKLITIVMVGQPELALKLGQHELRQVADRIAVQAELRPLTVTESLEYIDFRISRARRLKMDVFTPQAKRLIARAAHGIPRRINVICDNALVSGYARQERPVQAATVTRVLRDQHIHSPSPRRPILAFAAVGTLVLALSGLVLVIGLSEASVPEPDGAPPAAEAPMASALSAPTEALAQAPPPAEQAVAAPAAPAPATEPAPEPVVSSQSPAPAPATEPASEPVVSNQSPAPAPEAETAPAPIAAQSASAAGQEPAPVAAPEPASAAGPTPFTEPAPAPAPAPDEIAAVEVPGATAGPMPSAADMATEAVPVPEMPEAAPEINPAANASAPSPVPQEETVPAPAVSQPPARATELSWAIRPGDTYEGILRYVYGDYTPELRRAVAQMNPEIDNINIILSGRRLVLPRLSGYTFRTEAPPGPLATADAP